MSREAAFRAHVTAAWDGQDDSAHDLGHLARVWCNCQRLADDHPGADLEVLEAAAWFHALVNLPKSAPNRAEASRLSAWAAADWLSATDFPPHKIPAVAHAIEAHSFSAGIAPRTIEALTAAAFPVEEKGGERHARVNRDLVGRDCDVLGAAAGVRVPKGTDLLFGETEEDHPFVQEEQMMPFVPIVRVRDTDAGIAASLRAEHGYRHTAIIHSRNMENVARMARALNTTLFVHNGPCGAALGSNSPGYLSFSIATPTGEGVTTPLTFTRQRQILLGGPLRIF